MALHKAEQILAAVVATLTGLATTGSNVTRGRVYDIEERKLPHLSVYRGANAPVADGDQNIAFSDWRLDVRVEATVKSAAAQVDTVLAQIDTEVTKALKADITQGLGFVWDTREGGSLEPNLDGGGDQVIGAMTMNFSILYQRAINDPSQ